MLFFVWNVFNLIDSIVIVTSNHSEGDRIFYSIFSFILLQPVSLFVFYKGYRSLAEKGEDDTRQWYLRMQILVCIICFLALIFDFYGFNGLLMLFNISGLPFVSSHGS